MLNLVNIFAGLTWNPGIRGVLVVAVAVMVLIGSVGVLLSTNSGVRLGAMLVITALFGWLFLMGIIWSIYGIGDKGAAPAWKVKELSYDTTKAENPKARDLPNADRLPTAKSFLDRDKALKKQFSTQPKPPTLGDLLGVDPKLSKQIHTGKIWELLATSDPQTGDAAATATAFLGPDQQNVCASSTDCVVLNAYTTGGRPKRTDNSLVGRAIFKVESIFKWATLDNPPHYAVIQFRKAIPQAAIPGQAPPLPVADNSQPVMSVIMIRDLGSKRLPSVKLAILMGVAFFVCCSILNHREKIAIRNRSGA